MIKRRFWRPSLTTINPNEDSNELSLIGSMTNVGEQHNNHTSVQKRLDVSVHDQPHRPRRIQIGKRTVLWSKSRRVSLAALFPSCTTRLRYINHVHQRHLSCLIPKRASRYKLLNICVAMSDIYWVYVSSWWTYRIYVSPRGTYSWRERIPRFVVLAKYHHLYTRV